MDVLMPQLGETVSEGTISAWHKKAGDAVEKGEILLDVETDKVATEIPAPVSGVLSSINVEEGDTVDVGTVLAVIAAEGEVVSDASSTAAAEPAAAVSAKPAKAAGLPEKSAGNRLSPAVRRLLSKNGLDIADIQGTGRDGRVTKQDVQNHIDAAASGGGEVAGETGSERIPFDRIRRVTAEHMVRSKTTSPHVLQAIDADFSAVDHVRLARKDQWRAEKGCSLTYLPFVARALCIAIADFPRVNASVENETLLVHKVINLAIAVDLEFKGLVAPVVRNAADLKVSGLSERFHELAVRAKDGKLSPDDLQGGTYTLSNPGPFGTLFTSAIINQPQVAILSMDAIKKRAVVVEAKTGDTIEVRPVGILAHSFDHRAIDGAYSAAFLSRLKNVIEQSDWDEEF
jgi:2-oxoglutarate dehydrogenase E2 component (dihydrolipoamide succinyltransferase)